MNLNNKKMKKVKFSEAVIEMTAYVDGDSEMGGAFVNWQMVATYGGYKTVIANHNNVETENGKSVCKHAILGAYFKEKGIDEVTWDIEDPRIGVSCQQHADAYMKFATGALSEYFIVFKDNEYKETGNEIVAWAVNGIIHNNKNTADNAAESFVEPFRVDVVQLSISAKMLKNKFKLNQLLAKSIDLINELENE